MIQNILTFVDTNINFITICVCILALLIMYKENNNYYKEHLTDEMTSNTFGELVKKNKKMNFRCNINGINYYLAQLPISDCEKTSQLDCYNTIAVLIAENKINSALLDYEDTINTNIKKCNFDLHNKYPKKYSMGEQIESCNIDRFYIHDFNVTDVTNIANTTTINNNIKKYLFEGTSVPNTNNSISPTMLNQHLLNEKIVPLLCGDSFAYKGSKLKENGEVIVSETKKNNGTITIKLIFNTSSLMKQTVNGVDVYKKWPLDNPTKYFSYVGVCNNESNYMFKCKNGNIEYKRLCLISGDNVNTNNTILEFEPILVNK